MTLFCHPFAWMLQNCNFMKQSENMPAIILQHLSITL